MQDLETTLMWGYRNTQPPLLGGGIDYTVEEDGVGGYNIGEWDRQDRGLGPEPTQAQLDEWHMPALKDMYTKAITAQVSGLIDGVFPGGTNGAHLIWLRLALSQPLSEEQVTQLREMDRLAVTLEDYLRQLNAFPDEYSQEDRDALVALGDELLESLAS